MGRTRGGSRMEIYGNLWVRVCGKASVRVDNHKERRRSKKKRRNCLRRDWRKIGQGKQERVRHDIMIPLLPDLPWEELCS